MGMETQVGRIRLGDINEATKIAGISKSEIHRLSAESDFPKPVRFGPRCTRYPLHEVEQWVVTRLADRNQPARVNPNLKPRKPKQAALPA